MQSPILYNPSPTTLSHYLLSLEAIKGIGDRGMKRAVGCGWVVQDALASQ